MLRNYSFSGIEQYILKIFNHESQSLMMINQKLVCDILLLVPNNDGDHDA